MNAQNFNFSVTTSTFALPPDAWLVIPSTYATGGVTRKRKVIDGKPINEGRGKWDKAENETTVADVNERRRAEEIANRAKSAVAKFLQYVDDLGYIASTDTLAKLDAYLEGIKLEADSHNASARYSTVRVHIARVKLDKNIGPEDVALLAARLRTELEAMRDALKAGDIKKYRVIRTRSPNLTALCVGAVRMAVEAGLKDAESAYDAICENNRERTHAEKKGMPLPQLLDPSTLNVGQLDTAIELLIDS